MNLRLPALIPWMVLAGLAHGQVRSASVLYTYRQGHSQPGYRLGDECFVSEEAVEAWGWKVAKQGESVNLTAEGHTVHLDTRFVGGRPSIPLRKAVSQLGGASSWTAGTDTLNVYSVLSELSVQDLRVHAESGMPFKATVFYISPGRTVVDLEGVRIGSATQEDFPSNVRVVPSRPNTVRLTIKTPFVPKFPDDAPPASTEFDYQISRDQELAEVQAPARPSERKIVHPQSHVADDAQDQEVPRQSTFPREINPAPQTHGPQLITLTVDREAEDSTTMGVHVAGGFSGEVVVSRPDPASLEILFPVPVELPTPDFVLATKSVRSVSTRRQGSGTVLTIALARSMGSEVVTEKNGVTITLFKPIIRDPKLAGKTIVVDPGHGGHDRGAHVGDLNEKDLNLSIGTRLAHKLSAAGATVIMTRQDDTFIPLLTRSSISNNSHADMFISCHINSTGGSGSQSGTITFHHIGSKSSKFLAECIQDQIRRVNHLPNLGAWSDGKIYGSGFSVLRNTYAPAVLIEMGFINHPRDRARMITADFQDSVTTAVVKGVRVFLGESNPNE